MRKRLEASQSLCYQNLAEFVSDARRAFRNCFHKVLLQILCVQKCLFFFGDVLKHCNKMLCYTCFSAWTGSYRSRRKAQWAVWRTSEKRLPRPNFSWDDTFVLFWLSLLTSLFYPVSSKQMFPSFPELAEVLCVTSESLCHSVACSNNERYSLVTSGTVLLFWSTCINIEVLRKNNQELWSVWSVWGGKRRKIKLLLTS